MAQDSPALGATQVSGSDATSPISARRSRAELRRRRRRESAAPLLAISPFYVIFGIFSLFPFLFTIFLSFNSWDLLGGREFVGMRNWHRLMTDPLFWTAVRNTLSIFVLSTVPQFVFGLLIAAILNDRTMRGARWFRLTLLLPNLTSSVAVAIIFSVIFDRFYGVANYMLGLAGIGPVDWRASTIGTQVVIAMMLAWAFTGYTALILYAGMRNIPRHYYDAASLDGAGKIAQFFWITLPQLKPVLIFAGVTASIGGMQVLAEPLIFTGPTGGADNQALTLQLYMYTSGFRYNNFGYAATIAVSVLFLAGMVAAVNYAALRRFRGD